MLFPTIGEKEEIATAGLIERTMGFIRLPIWEKKLWFSSIKFVRILSLIDVGFCMPRLP